MRKYGTGRILRNDDEVREQKVAYSNFTAKDREELKEELAQDAPESDSER